MQNDSASSSFVYDAERDRPVWRTPDDNRIAAGRTEMNMDFTWSFWAKSVGNSGCMMGTRSGNYTRFYLDQMSGGYLSFGFPNNYTDGAWHHMVLRREGNVFSVYVDGVFEASKTQAAGDNNMLLEIGGAGQYNEDFDGYMSDVAIWAEALSLSRIQELAAGERVQPEHGTLFLLR